MLAAVTGAGAPPGGGPGVPVDAAAAGAAAAVASAPCENKTWRPNLHSLSVAYCTSPNQTYTTL